MKYKGQETKIIIDPNKELFLWKVAAVPFFSYPVFEYGIGVLSKKRWGFYWPKSYLILTNNGKDAFWYSQMSDVIEQGVKSYQTFFEDKNKRFDFRKIYQENTNDLLGFLKKINKNILSHLSNNELNISFQNLIKKYQIFWSVGVIPELAAYGGAYLLEKQVKEVYKNNSSEIIRVLSEPTELSFHIKEQIELLKIGSKIYQNHELKKLLSNGQIDRLLILLKNEQPQIFKQLLLHQRKYHWILNGYWGATELNINYFLDELADLVDSQPNPQKIIDKIITNKKRNENEKNLIIKKFKPSKNIVSLGIGAGSATSWQDIRKAVALIVNYYLDLFLKEFSKRQNLSKDDLKFLIPKEILDLKKSKSILKRISSRKIACTLEFDNSIVKLIEKNQSLKIFQLLEDAQQSGIKFVKEIKGMTVSIGEKIVRGRVRILKSAYESGKLQSDEILVTVMTSPDYILAMRKAKAIITDEGGLTCHAAIVSRELGKTCIVSTKIATKVLKDGDSVEINANKSIIKKL